MKNVLVTGGAGFIGSNFVRYLLKSELEVSVITFDALTYAGNLENLKEVPDPNRHHFIKGDVCNQSQIEKILRESDIDTIVHFAAETHVDRSIKYPEPFFQTNVMGTHYLLEAVRESWFRTGKSAKLDWRFVHISTDEVYGSLMPPDRSSKEGDPYSPNSPYAASKAASDHLVRAYCQTYGLPAQVCIISNTYGPYQYPEKLIPVVILNAIQRISIPLYGDGQQIRDWLYVEDTCEAIRRVIKFGRIGETYNIGAGSQTTNLELVQNICTFLDGREQASLCTPHASLIQSVADRPGHDGRYALDTSKIYNELEWKPQIDLESGLLKTVQWYFDNSQWAEKILARREHQEWVDANYASRGLIE